MAVVAAAALGIIVGSQHPSTALAGPEPALRWATWATAAAAALTAILSPASPRLSFWVAAAATCILLEEAGGPEAPWGWVITIALVAGSAHAGCCLAAATAVSAAQRFGWLRVSSIAITLVAVVLTALFFDPYQRGCRGCISNPLALTVSSTAADWIAAGCAAAVILVAICCLVSAVGRRNSLKGASRVVFAAAVLAAIVLAFPRLIGGADDVATGAGRAVATVAIAVAATGMWWSRIQEVRRRAVLANLVSNAAAAALPGGIEQALRAVTGDPGLTLRYRLDDTTLIDPTGALSMPPEGVVTELNYNGELIALLARTQAAVLDRRRIDLISTTAGLAIAHEREAAVLAAHLHALAGMRRNLIVAGDLERRALERELHDHAQQRLVSIMIELRMEAARESDPAEIEDALVDVQRALDEVREIGHGIFPEVLVEEGLAGALEELALDSGGRVTVEATGLDRSEAAEEATAYLIAAACARVARDDAVFLRVATKSGRLALETSLTGVADEAFAPLRARALALGGDWTIDGATLKVTLPCES